MQLGILGGTFDPPHVGHLEVARIVLASGLVDQVLFVPCYRHAFDKHPAAYEHRLEMCRRLVSNEPRMQVSDAETRLNHPGRTLELIELLSAELSGSSFRLIAGTDIYFERTKWYRFEQVEELAPPIYVGRRGQPPVPVPTLELPPDISSSRVREALRRNEDVSSWLTEEVWQYIVDKSLYKENSWPKKSLS